jgi:hypothetical protein
LNGSGPGLTEVLSKNLFGGTEEKDEILQSEELADISTDRCPLKKSIQFVLLL